MHGHQGCKCRHANVHSTPRHRCAHCQVCTGAKCARQSAPMCTLPSVHSARDRCIAMYQSQVCTSAKCAKAPKHSCAQCSHALVHRCTPSTVHQLCTCTEAKEPVHKCARFTLCTKAQVCKHCRAQCTSVHRCASTAVHSAQVCTVVVH